MAELSPAEKDILRFLEQGERPQKEVLLKATSATGTERIATIGQRYCFLRGLVQQRYVGLWWRDDESKRPGMCRCFITMDGRTALERSAS